MSLDFYLDSSHTNYEQIANQLLNRTVLMVNQYPHRICEVEFYQDPDPYIHGDSRQTVPGKWYFHRQSGGGYKGGTFKGLDITFRCGSSNSNNHHGWILIRSIQNSETGTRIEGPCNVVDEILKLTGKTSITQLVIALTVDLVPNVLDQSTMLYLLYTDTTDNYTIYTAPRVGLSLLQNVSKKCHYIMKNYRYLIKPESVKRFRNGITLKMYHSGMSVNDIIKTTRISKHILSRYIHEYQEGKNIFIQEKPKWSDYFAKFGKYTTKKLRVKDENILIGLCYAIEDTHENLGNLADNIIL